MKQLINKITINNKFIFITLLIIATVFIFPFFIPHFALDSYSLLESGYHNYAIHFMKSGRVVAAIFYEIFNFIKLPFTTASIISTMLSGIILVITAITYGNVVINNLKAITKEKKILIYTISFLCFFNFMNIELFVFIESFIMCLGIYLIVQAVKMFVSNNKYKYIFSFLYLIISILCYQGIICLFIPLLLILLYLKHIKNFEKINYKQLIKEMIYSGLFYIGVLIIAYLSIKLITNFLNISEAKSLQFDILNNLTIILSFIVDTMKSFFGFFSTKVFYIVIILLLGIYSFIKFTTKEKNKIIRIIYLVFLLGVCVLLPFIPNLFLSSESNYVAARMTTSIGLIIPIILFFIIFDYEKIKLKHIKYILVFITLMFLFYTGYQYNTNFQLSVNTYREDKKSIDLIYQEINKYEITNKTKIIEIYYGYDPNVNYYYSDVYNGFNYRVMAIDWAFLSALNGLNNRKFKFVLLSEEEINDRFNNIDYNEFNEKQLIFENQKLYLYLY